MIRYQVSYLTIKPSFLFTIIHISRLLTSNCGLGLLHVRATTIISCQSGAVVAYCKRNDHGIVLYDVQPMVI